MSDVVLLGAGASADAEVPLTDQLTEEILKRLRGEDQRALRFVCERLRTAGEDDSGKLDVEQVFSTVELLAERKSLALSPFVKGWDSEVSQWDCDFYAALCQRMIEAMRQSIATTQKQVGYLQPLVRWAADRRATIATLNYDRSIEVAGEVAGIPVTTGVGSWVDRGRWTWPSNEVCLLKLHGSIDWAWEDDPPAPGQMPSRFVAQSALPAEEKRPPVVIFGLRGKLRAEGPFLSALHEFEARLRRAKRLIVIGYSFRDDHVNQAIRRWTFGGFGHTLELVDPCLPEQLPAPAPDLSFRDQLLAHLEPSDGASGTRLELIRSSAKDALPRLLRGAHE
ncbi:MAG TPA: SIR2 family protein [Solirubrobacterales bacterium]